MTGSTVLIADDHPLFRQALQLAVARARPGTRIIETTSLRDALDAARLSPDLDLVLLDLRMSDCQGFAGLAQLHAERPGVPILVVSGVDQSDAEARARRFGAVGFVPKAADLDAIARAIDAAMRGEVQAACAEPPEERELSDVADRIASLTPTQLKVLLGVLAGRLNKQIAYDLNIAEATVKAHMTAVLRKLNVLNRTQAALAARALALEPEAAV
jgi:DNA-binding NarL/FixJ family response regulator